MSANSFPFRRILVAVDRSEQAAWAVDLAVRLARQSDGARLELVHVLFPPAVFGCDFAIPGTPWEAGARRHAERLLEALRRRVPPGVEVDTLLRDGDAPGQIVAAARERGADLIVMGTCSHSPATHLLLGSISKAVVRHAPCPVLTVGHRLAVADDEVRAGARTASARAASTDVDLGVDVAAGGGRGAGGSPTPRIPTAP